MKKEPRRSKLARKAFLSADQRAEFPEVFGEAHLGGERDDRIQPAAVGRGKRNSLLAMAAFALVGLTARGAEATTVPSDEKDASDASKSPVRDAGEQNNPGQTVHNFKIPAGTLKEVLAAVEKDTGVSFAFASDDIGALQSPGVTGVLTMQEALSHVLANTGVSARFESADRVVLSVTGDKTSVEVHADVMPSPKYTAPLVDLPQTVSVISQETMQNTASSTLMEALRTVPGITFGAGEGGNPLGDRPFIRGMDAQSSTYIDGIRDIAAQSREVFDIESVEVEEGPGGAYGGRGTGGGSINMNSKLARRDNFIAGSFVPGTSNYKRGTLDANAKLGSLVSGRITGVWHDADVAGRDAVHTGRWGVAPSLAIGLGGPTRAYLDYYHLVSSGIPDSGVPYNNPSKVPTNDPGERVLQPGDGQPLKIPHRGMFWGLTDRDHNNSTVKAATGRVERDLWNEHALLRDSYRYERTETDYVWTLPDDSQGNIYYGLLFRRINDRVSAVFTSDNQTDLSGQFKTGKFKHTYAVGMEFSSERGNNDSYNVSSSTSLSGGTETCPLGAGAADNYNCVELFAPDYHDPWTQHNTLPLNHNPTHSKSVTQSAYAFDTIVFTPHLQSTVGGRYDHYDSTFSPAKSATAIPKQEVENNIGTYLASVIYKPDSPTSIYGTVSTASIPTGSSLAQGVDTSNLSTVGNADLQPEQIREEEIGVKREFNRGRALARIDLFREDIQNVRITQADGTIAAAGNDRTLGWEAGLSGMITRKWQFTGGYTYLDAILTNAGGAGAANGATNGQAMPNTARHSVSITSSYGILPRLHAGGGIYGMTKVWGSQANNKWVPGYVREDIFANYELNEHINLQMNIQNVGDTYYFQQAYQTHYAIPGPGRTALFGLNMKF